VTRVLFVAEAVTLAHVGRALALAARLPSHCEVAIAMDPSCHRFAAGTRCRIEPLYCIGSESFLRRLARGSGVYEAGELRRYVQDDLALIERVRPDVVVGDFRLSLSVSARLAKVPYATVTNAYWSPFSADRDLPMPVLPVTRALPLSLARPLFAALAPFVMRRHARAMNLLRAEHGLAELEPDLRTVYTDADRTLYADDMQMFPMRSGLPSSHVALGPVLWSPPVAEPPWWAELPTDRPLVYVTLGSSGSAQVLPIVLAALAKLPVTVIASTAGGSGSNASVPENARLADYLPGTAAAARSRLVVCNGGSPTCQQAFAAGVPVLGIASNMDQFLNMRGVERTKAGLLLRADRVSVAGVAAACARLLGSDEARQAAHGLSHSSRRYGTDLFAAAIGVS
jgi:UDP:flavonoid glycosyltransferase YjiC (YdhE family)